MANNAAKKRNFGGAPPVDFLDLSYMMPVLSAAALKDSKEYPFKYGRPLRMAASLSHNAGRLTKWHVYERFIKALMVTPREAEDLRATNFAKWVVSLYEGRTYPYIVIGPPLGSLAYLAAVLDAPFLPLNFATAVRHDPIHPDKMVEHIDAAKKLADNYLKRESGIQIIHEYNPIHQRFRLKNASLLRFKFTDLPEYYKRFINAGLKRDGTIIFVESRCGWRQSKISDNYYHQVGTPGGIPDEEFIRGSKRITLFQEKFMQETASYRLNRPTEIAPESKYGILPSTRQDTLRTADAIKRDVCQLFTDDIYQINLLVSNLFIRCARREGMRPKYCYVHSGNFLAPYWCMHSLIIPVWTPSPCYPALQYTSDFLKGYPYEMEKSLISFEPSMEGAPDFIQLERWIETISEKSEPIFMGTNPNRYPADFSSTFNYWSDISKWARKRRQTLDMRIAIDHLIKEAENCNIKFQVTLNK